MSKVTDKERFITICNTHIHRDGIDRLLEYLKETDFYTAPASSKFHLSVPGGLLRHSLNVYDELLRLVNAYGFEDKISHESIAITSLFHDFCKIGLYKQGIKTVYVDGERTCVPSYTRDEQFHYGGHGSKSVFLVERFIRLTDEEAVAINCHMGTWDGNMDVSGAYEQYPLAWMLHVADEAATFLLESE